MLLIDDLLATGGTAGAAVDLVRQCGGGVAGCAFLIELTALGGRRSSPATRCTRSSRTERDRTMSDREHEREVGAVRTGLIASSVVCLVSSPGGG